jgi:hypothetical protein
VNSQCVSEAFMIHTIPVTSIPYRVLRAE